MTAKILAASLLTLDKRKQAKCAQALYSDQIDFWVEYTLAQYAAKVFKDEYIGKLERMPE
jgi:hypothetical protein